ncbi:MAG TPA: exosortase/archaeosortase family protein [Candidatus Acidoferrum sp.]|nr:exosortase/archaeosortase family protein [Candidatus Acidoferrum sp.]
MNNSHPSSKKQWFLFSSWVVLSLLLFLSPVLALVRLALSQDDHSHLVIIPLISAILLYIERDKLPLQPSSDKSLSGIFLLLATSLALGLHYGAGGKIAGLPLSGWILALLLVWTAGFAFFFGKAALRVAYFPFLFLLLMVPIPNFLLDRIIFLLQQGSAWITGVLFDIAGVPALREGLVFHLAKVSIEVAKECSGIRSSMALFIVALLVAHFRLTKLWNKVFFVAFGLFLMILKNGVRIATLTLLAVYVNPDFLFGRLHHQGGVVFFVLALLLLLPVLSFLQRQEAKKTLAPEPS